MKNLIKNTCMLFVCLSFFVACETDNKIDDDFRNKYAGAYDFVTIRSSFSMLDSTCNCDTVSYRGRIYFSDTLESNEMVIHFLEYKSPVLIVDEQGTISEPGYNHTSGEFIGDSAVSLFFSWGGHGGGGSHSIEGKKN